MDATENDATLTPKALCVDDTGPPLSCHHIIPTEAETIPSVSMSFLLQRVYTTANRSMSRFVPYPSPRSSVLGGRAESVHTMYFCNGSQTFSSSPSSSQSWSPLHTRDWLTHIPEGQKTDRHLRNCHFQSFCTLEVNSFISDLIGSEICLHIHPLEGSLVWFHRIWSLFAPLHMGSLQTAHRQPWLGF